MRIDRHMLNDGTGVDRRASRVQGKTWRPDRGSGVEKSNKKEAWRRQTIESQPEKPDKLEISIAKVSPKTCSLIQPEVPSKLLHFSDLSQLAPLLFR